MRLIKDYYFYLCFVNVNRSLTVKPCLCNSAFSGITGPTGAPLPCQKPPPPPPKNPARLMALALTESANKALRQGASPPYRPRQAESPPDADTRPHQRSLSADAGAILSSDPDQLYSTVRPLSVWMSEGGGEVSVTEKATDLAQEEEEEPRSPLGQVCLCICVYVCFLLGICSDL